MDEAARDLWGVYEVELSKAYGLKAKRFEPGDENGARHLLQLRWTPAQIRLGLSAAAALAARFPEQAASWWDGRQTWNPDRLRVALETHAALRAAETKREDELARMPALHALPGGRP